MHATERPFYITGGTLRHDSPSYVERQADKDIFQGLLKSEFCYVLTSRQMGKSSLMVRTANRLRERRVSVVVLDLTAIGLNLTPEQWYNGLISRLGRQLSLEDEVEDFWRANERLSPVQCFFSALRDAVLPRRPGPLVIFVDEIDTVRSLPFSTDEFFAAIRECYNRRTEDAEFSRLTFCLLGVATPSDLIRDARTTPFNIGTRIELTDFAPDEAKPLALGLLYRGVGSSEHESVTMDQHTQLSTLNPQHLLDRILYWTNGHPYLTQRLCRALVESAWKGAVPAAELEPARCIDELCEQLFLSSRAREQDDNLLFVRERFLRSEAELTALFNLYERIRNRQRVRDDEANELINHLRLTGITRLQKGCLVVRNRIYHRVFDQGWIRTNRPETANSGKSSIAVLPFTNTSGDVGNDYLSDGITEDLIIALSQIDGLRVPGRTSTFLFKGKTKDIWKIGERLAVEFILAGTVRKAGRQLRITVQLINVADGFQIWSAKYDRQMDDVFAVQDEISHAIVEALKIQLGEGAEIALVKRQTASAEAYQLYLQGRFHWNQRGLGLKKSLHYFELALLEDPQYALAYAGLADAYNLLGFYNHLPPKRAIPKAKAAALSALQLDEQLAEAHGSLGFAQLNYHWEWAAAEEQFKRALELNPNYANARYWYGTFLAAVGRSEESIAQQQRAVQLDPLSSLAHAQLGWLYLITRQYDQAGAPCRKALELEPDSIVASWILGQVHAAKGELAQAIPELQKAAHQSGGSLWMLASLGYVYGLAGQRQQAQQVLAQLKKGFRGAHRRSSLLAIVHIGLGDKERALEFLHKSFQEGDVGLVWLKADPAYDTLRAESRFADLLRKVGLDTTSPTIEASASV
jgi:TolB-like protein/Tfp pilus assembly protein PilF